MSDRGLPPVEVAPLRHEGHLSGFVIVGRWPEDTFEWADFLVLAVTLAAVPGTLPAGGTVFRVAEELPEAPPDGAVGLVVAEGSLLGEHPLRPGRFADRTPAGLAVLHPPGSTASSLPEHETASGCLLLPGLPELGLDHRAAWVEADAHGHVARLASRSGVDPAGDADTAALALLLAA